MLGLQGQRREDIAAGGKDSCEGVGRDALEGWRMG